MLSDRFCAAVEGGNVDQVRELFHEQAAFSSSPVLASAPHRNEANRST
jgi:hypothetical protein